ncbi:MAG: EF-P beta-lysylation protein EpmB, partial [Gammaproteobacteria bacterium PRO8]|nr:EF-P beta-lysylation protein EpmB [Gammaproteobacteria bacterium PRO8]
MSTASPTPVLAAASAWQRELARAITSPGELAAALGLPAASLAGAADASA